MTNNLTYIARGNSNQLLGLRDKIANLLDTTIGMQRVCDAARTLDEAIAAQPPRPEEVDLSEDSEFVQALMRYRATKPPMQQISIEQKGKTEIPYEWYINPVFSFSGTIGITQDEYGNQVPAAAEVARILREGTVKMDYNSGGTARLTLTMDYDPHSGSSLRVVFHLDQIFANAQCEGIDINQQ